MIIDLPIGTWVQRKDRIGPLLGRIVDQLPDGHKVVEYGRVPAVGTWVHEIVRTASNTYASKRTFRWKEFAK